jgi:hypothetical protein
LALNLWRQDQENQMATNADENFERTRIDADGLRAWALRRGFSESADGGLAAPYGNIEVHIDLDPKRVRVSRVWQGKSSVIIEGPIAAPSPLHVDQFDMVHGIGLFTRFYADFKETGVRPVWFSDALLDYMDDTRRSVD